jgi:hypothetical protein
MSANVIHDTISVTFSITPSAVVEGTDQTALPLTYDKFTVVFDVDPFSTGNATFTLQEYDAVLDTWWDFHTFTATAGSAYKHRVDYPAKQWDVAFPVGYDDTPALAAGNPTGPTPRRPLRLVSTSPGALTGTGSVTANVYAYLNSRITAQ